MSLIENMMESCCVMNKIRTSDGEGGFITTWNEGASLKCAIVNDTSMQARIAEAQKVTSTYTITVTDNVDLEFHDVIKRLRDGKTFRITSDPNDKETPSVASFSFKQFTAEAWILT